SGQGRGGQTAEGTAVLHRVARHGRVTVGPRVLVAAACLVVVGTGCAGAGAAPHATARAGHGAARGPLHGRTTVAQHRTIVNPGVHVQRLIPPPGQAFHPTCPARTLIGTAAAPRVVARTSPDDHAQAIASFPRVNEEGSRQVFDLLNEVQGSGGNLWYRALLPMRPNDSLGYIPAGKLTVQWTDYWVLVERGRFRLTLYQSCRAIAQFPVGIGTGSTPTPVGVFFLQSLLQPPDPNGVYGEYAYGLSGYSSVIHDWRWGGLVGLQGTNDPAG